MRFSHFDFFTTLLSFCFSTQSIKLQFPKRKFLLDKCCRVVVDLNRYRIPLVNVTIDEFEINAPSLICHFFVYNNRTRSDRLRPSGCPTIARLHGRSPSTGRVDRADSETGPTAKPATMGRTTVEIAGQLHRFGCCP